MTRDTLMRILNSNVGLQDLLVSLVNERDNEEQLHIVDDIKFVLRETLLGD